MVQNPQPVTNASTMPGNQQTSVTTNGVQSATAQKKPDKKKEQDGIMGFLSDNWGWVLAGVAVVATAVVLLVRNRNKDKDKEKAKNLIRRKMWIKCLSCPMCLQMLKVKMRSIQ